MNWVCIARLFTLGAFLLPVAARAASPLTIYDDQLRNGFSDWSWATHSIVQTAVVHGGTAAMSFVPASWGALYLHTDAGLDTGTYEAIEFWVNGAGSGHQAVRIAFLTGTSVTGSTALLSGFVAGGAIPAGQWAKVRVPFASLGLDTATAVNGFWLQDDTGAAQPAVYVDDVVATVWATTPPPPAPGQPVSVAVDPSLDRHPVSPLIFGVNFGSAAQALRLHWPVRRWGGNSTTRYSWQDDISNHAMDWFFYNIEEANSNPAALPDGSAADQFVDDTRAAGGTPLVTVPLIGWTPIDRVRRWGFSVAKYGAQQQTECTATGGASWCQPDAGNGVKPDGTTMVTGNDPHDTSREIGPPFVTGWMAHLSGRTGTAGQGGVQFWALDNEPMLWNSTHRDVHPVPTTYDELWQKTAAMAAAMKAQDPGAKLFGPALWGWCAYFFSAADGCAPGADQAAHGNVPFLPWYLAQAAQYEAQHGVRLIDFADVHYYPEANGVTLSDDESAATSALRLRSLKSLYDPSYVDESWIGQPVALIPRLRGWIAANYPGTKIAISEYNWGNDDGISSTLAQAEALAIFGREEVDAATRWIAPADGSSVEDAFLLHLNYDGAGATTLGDSVRAVSSIVDAVGAYAVQKPSGTLVLLLFNKDTVIRPVTSTIAGSGSAPVRLFSFDATHRLSAAGTASLTSGVLALDLPARSATLAEIATVCTLPAKPTITPSGATTFCTGGSVTLTSSAGTTYFWSTGATTSSISVTTSGSYWVQVTNANACQSPQSDLAVVTVNPTPTTPVITAPASTMAGTTGLTASVVSHAGSSWFWTILNGTIMSGQGTNQITFTAGMAGTPLTLSVTETNASGCVSVPGNATVTVAPTGSGALFYTLPPCRVLDTRNQTEQLGAPSLQPGATRTFDVTASPCGIPAGAVAISANLTVTNIGAQGELVVFRSDISPPNTSAISFRAGRTRANNSVVSLSGSSATFSVFNNSAATVDFIVDVNGFFR